MEQYIGRSANLEKKFNQYLHNLTGINQDYYSTLKPINLFELKAMLSDINNILTLKLTLSAVKWLCDYFKLDNNEKKSIIANIDKIKPNSNGFDIIIESKKVIAEVKCINPINNGNKYGGSQWHSILKDVINLLEGKKQLKDTSKYLKFLFLIDFGRRTDDAITELLRPSNATSKNQDYIKRHNIKINIALHNDSSNPECLTTDKIFIKKIKIE